jgi:hypothetical protein
MIPKNLAVFKAKTEELLNEIDQITSTLSEDLKSLQLRKNEFRDKCLQFLDVSFEYPNKYWEKFHDEIYETDQNSIYLDLPHKPIKMLLSNELQQFDYMKHLLSAFMKNCQFVDSVVSEIPSGISEQGLYFKGEYYDAIFKLSEIIKTVKADICVVDNYINEDLINFLNKNKPEKIRIMTTKASKKDLLNLNLLLKNIPALEIRLNDTFHDRFIIIDDNRVYHFGHSLKQLGNKTFMFSSISDVQILNTFKNKFEEEWESSKTYTE